MADENPLDFTGKVVVVTGGCRGVGRGIAESFLAAGADVVVCCRNEPETLPAVAGREAMFVAADVREPDQIDTVIAATTERFGHLDVLINNAGGSPPADPATASPKFSTAIINLNLIAPLVFSQRANAVMQAQPEGGVILNIGSLSGLRANPESAAYGVAKAGIVNLTETLGVVFAPKVRVVCVTAGPIVTELAHIYYGDDEGIAAVGSTIALGRMADPSDVADVCLFAASSLARYVTGTQIVVHGGGEKPAYMNAANAES